MRITTTTAHRVPALLALLVFAGALVLYARTAAPSVLSGDSAEFQFAAPLLGVPHPTGYPLYTLLAKLATLLVPFGDIAHRVTLVSSLAGAATVAVVALLARRAAGGWLAALIAAVMLATSPGMWNVSTLAEVYTLNTLLLALLALALWKANELHNEKSSTSNKKGRAAALAAAAFLTGLGFSNHGSFAFLGVPLFLLYGVVPLAWERKKTAGDTKTKLATLARLALWGALGLTPWLFVLLHYARFGPFDTPFSGIERGTHSAEGWQEVAYFWGAPASWSAAVNHLFGGTMRGGVFVLPDLPTLGAAARALLERLRFEFGMAGLLLGGTGCFALLCRAPRAWIGSAWVAGATALYVASLSQAVQDAMIFTLPMLLPWALWAGAGAEALAQSARTWGTGCAGWRTGHSEQRIKLSSYLPQRAYAACQHAAYYGVLLLLLLAVLAWGQGRLPYGDKSHLWLFREFGQGVLARVETGAVVVSRWEQSTTLHYLRLVEGQRPDVWVDSVELEDEDWRERAQRRYAGKTVYAIGSLADAAALEGEPVWSTDYATLFLLETDEHEDKDKHEHEEHEQQ
jgi:hypothetical protein